MFEMDNTKDSFTITDYTTANILNTYNVEEKSNEKGEENEEKKTHNATKNINFFNNAISSNVNYVLKYKPHKHNKKTTFTCTQAHKTRGGLLRKG